MVRQGLLIRRQGSGTFVRRPTPPNPSRPHPPIALSLLLGTSPEAATEAPPTALQTGSLPPIASPGLPAAFPGLFSRHPLSLGLLHTPHGTRPHHQMLEAFEHTGQTMGHTLKPLSPNTSPDEPVDAEQLRSAFQQAHCDGYLALADWVQPLHQLSPGQIPPLVLLGDPGTHGHPWPAVRYHGSLGVEHGLRELAAHYQRIGLIALTGSVSRYTRINQESHRRAHATGLQRAGLPENDLIAFTQGGVAQSSVEAFAATRQLLERADPPDALYVTDDHLIYGILEALKQAGRRVGGDFGLITYCVRGAELPPDLAWSRFEIDYAFQAQLAIDLLIKSIQGQEPATEQLLIAPRWVPGETHRRQAPHPGSLTPPAPRTGNEESECPPVHS